MSDTTHLTGPEAPKPPRKRHRVRNTVLVVLALGTVGGIASAASGGSHPAAATAPPASSAPAAPKWQSQGAACTPEGAIGKDYSGTPLTCQGGSWSYYPEPVASDPASQPGTGNHPSPANPCGDYGTWNGASCDYPASPAPATSKPSAPAPAQPAGPTVSQQQALTAAQSYLDLGSGFSRAGLIDQLSSQYGNKFSVADATWAADHSGADWNAQAVMAAKGYMNLGSGFSRAGLIDQLTSPYGNKFTYAQATYAANQVGL
jgi:hypothetical protein